MHADQMDVVAGLVAAQFPRWRELPVRAVASAGTVNALFRLGEEFVLRFPLRPRFDSAARAALVAEQGQARRIAAAVPVAVPEPVAFGEPGEGYPGLWTVYRWITGDTATGANIGNAAALMRDLETGVHECTADA